MTELTEEKYKNQIALAWKEYEDKNSEKAKELCLQINTEFPEKLGANYLLGIIYFDEKKYEDSLQQMKLALRKDDEKKTGGFINYWIGQNYGEKTYSFEKNNPVYNKDLSRVSYEKALEYESYPEEVINQLNYIYQNNFNDCRMYYLNYYL